MTSHRTNPGTILVILVLTFALGLLSRTARADFTKEIVGIAGRPVQAIAVWDIASCSQVLAVASFTVNVAPQYGTVSFTDIPGIPPGCPAGGPALTAAAADYTLTAFPPGVSSDSFQLNYVVNGAVAGGVDITVVQATLSIASALPSGTAGVVYPPAVLVSGGVPPYTVSASGLPPGLTINTDGTVSGTPATTDSGTYQIAVSQVTDSVGVTAGPATVPITIAPPPANILLNGNVVTAPQNVFVGQQIVLSASLPSGGAPASGNPWTVDGPVVGGFNTSPSGDEPSTGNPVDVTYSPSGVTFYWIGPGAFPVRYNYTVDGQSTSVSVTFNVSGPANPTIEVTASQSAFVGSPKRSRSLFVVYGVNGSHGLTFTASSELPASNPGRYQWVQLLVGETEIHTKFDGRQTDCSVRDVSGALDNAYPYNPILGENPVHDSPYVRVLPDDRKILFSLSADMYLMWDPLLPQGCDLAGPCTSIPVPLGYVTWQVTLEASRLPPTRTEWDAKAQESTSLFNPLTSYPEWTSIITNRVLVSCQ